MELINPGQKTLVVTTTPTRSYGLDKLNKALEKGWRVTHVAPLGYSEPGTDALWPEGYVSTLLLMERRVPTPDAGPLTRTVTRSVNDEVPPSDLPWTDYAL